jgi:hypothetical protein
MQNPELPLVSIPRRPTDFELTGTAGEEGRSQ